MSGASIPGKNNCSVGRNHNVRRGWQPLYRRAACNNSTPIAGLQHVDPKRSANCISSKDFLPFLMPWEFNEKFYNYLFLKKIAFKGTMIYVSAGLYGRTARQAVQISADVPPCRSRTHNRDQPLSRAPGISIETSWRQPFAWATSEPRLHAESARTGAGIAEWATFFEAVHAARRSRSQ